MKIGDLPVLSARIDLPLSGRWTALVRYAPASAPTGSVTISCDALDLVGTVARSRAYLDATEAWIVGGAGGVNRDHAGAWQSAQVRDVLGALANAAGESLDASIASSLLSLPLNLWHASGRVAAGLYALAGECSRRLGAPVNWRFLPSGKLWMGTETWPAESLPAHAYVVDEVQSLDAAIVGCEEPTLLPGADVAGVGKVAHVTHRIEPSSVRSEVQRWN